MKLCVLASCQNLLSRNPHTPNFEDLFQSVVFIFPFCGANEFFGMYDMSE